MGEIVLWRGARFDPRTRDMLVELASIVSGYVQPTQGSYNDSVEASGGTHDGGGAVDIAASNLTDVQEQEVVLWGRRIGFAMWLRQASKSWPKHIHGIAIGCPDLSPAARDQVEDYREGRNGLANNGPDDGPDVPFTTWEIYQRENDVTPEEHRKITREEIERVLVRDTALVNIGTKAKPTMWSWSHIISWLQRVHGDAIVKPSENADTTNPTWYVNNAIGTILDQTYRSKARDAQIISMLAALQETLSQIGEGGVVVDYALVEEAAARALERLLLTVSDDAPRAIDQSE